MSYQHNEDYYWLCPLDYCTAVNTYGEPLFSILEQNGYETGAFLSLNNEITRPIFTTWLMVIPAIPSIPSGGVPWTESD